MIFGTRGKALCEGREERGKREAIGVQKLEEEKRKALASGVPTAEKAQLSSSATAGHGYGAACVPMVPPADVRREGLTKSAVPGAEGVAAERHAERREAQLRSQAQLRVRLAAAKRRMTAALQGVKADDNASATRGADGTEPLVSGMVNVDGNGTEESRVSQEDVLRKKLRARKAA